MVREQHVERCLRTMWQENVHFLCSVASVANNLPSNAKVYVVLCYMDVVLTEHRDLNSSTY
jgi:hypothetical protein